MNSFLSFFLLIVSAELILSALQFSLRKKQFKKPARALLIVAKLLLGIGFAVLVLAGPVSLRKVQPMMTALYVVLFTDALADAVYCIICLISKKKRSFSIEKAASLLLAVLFTVYGFFNMQTIRSSERSFSSDKVSKSYTFAFIADLHVGSAQKFETTKKTVEAVKAEKPDFLILGGDITDDYTLKDEMEDCFALFKDFGAPVYYVYGNHDRQGHAEYAIGHQYTEEEFEKAMTDNGIIILKDEVADFNDEVSILGREDLSEKESRKDILTIEGIDASKYLIVADHQPNDIKGNIRAGADLQVSGHTHAGQLFPLRALYSLIGYVYGVYDVEGVPLVVNAGACGWRFPIRTDAHCEYELITITPEK